MRFLAILLMCILALPGIAVDLAVAAPGTISSISLTPGDGDQEIIRISLTGLEAPKVFTIKGDSPRLVLDFANATYHGKAKIAVAKSKLVQSIRSAVHRQPALKTRVVVDLFANQEVSHQEDFQAETGLLTVTLELAGQAKKTKAEGKAPVAPDQLEPPSTKSTITTPLPAAEPGHPPAGTSATPSNPKGPAVPPATLAPSPVAAPGGGPATGQQAPAAPPPAAPAVKPSVAAPTGQTAEPKAAITEGKKTLVPFPPTLLDVSFVGTSAKGELVQLKLNGFYAPKISAIEEGLPQVICEYSDMAMESKVPRIIPAEGKFVKTIRITGDAAKKNIRIVLELQPNKSYDLQQVYFKDDQIFVLIVNELKKSPSLPVQP